MMELQNLQPETVCATQAGLEKTEMPDGFVIFQAETEKVHYLNPTASIIFELSDGAKSVAEIAAYLQEAYNLPELPLQETLTCTQTLIDQGLLHQCRK